MRIAFGEWAPDIVDIAAPDKLEQATNVIPEIDGYSPVRAPAPKTDALNGGKCLGAVWYADDQGAAQVYAGTSSTLEVMTSATAWTDISDTGGYTTSTDWQFTKWGNQIIATNGSEAPQYQELGSGDDFAVVTNAPIASTVGVIGDFVVFGNTVESSTNYPSRVRWSGFNNFLVYGSSLATQADFQDLTGNGGNVQKIVSGPVGVIFLERSIWTMEYEGPPTVFKFYEVETSRGTPAKNSVCTLGSLIFFYAHDGFHVFSIGTGSKPIGRGRVDKWFLANANTERLNEMRGVVDRERNLVFWSFASVSAGTNCDKLLVYSIVADKWSVANVESECIFEVYGPGYNLDTLDSILDDIDIDSINTESRAFLEGALLIGVVTNDHKTSTLDGDPLTATLETGEFGGGYAKTRMRRITPVVDGGTASAYVGSRDQPSENVSWTLEKQENSRGCIPVRINARYHKVRTEIPDGFNRAFAIDVDMV